MTSLVPFNDTLPAHIKPKAKIANMFAALVRNGFKVLSIKSKVFTVVDGENRQLVTKPNDPDTPAANLEIVILAANPNKSRVYYKAGYEEGAANKPTCYTNDNIAPASDAAEPQAKKCATCPHAQYGSRINEAGKKAFACSEAMRVAVAPVGQLNDPMLLRVPPTSLKALGKYGNDLALRGVEPYQVVTKIGFDYTVSHPALTFKATAFVSDAMLKEIEETRATDTVGYITGVVAMPQAEVDEGESFAPAPVAEPAAEEKPKAKPEAKKPEAKKPAPVAEVAADSVDDLDFDD